MQKAPTAIKVGSTAITSDQGQSIQEEAKAP